MKRFLFNPYTKILAWIMGTTVIGISLILVALILRLLSGPLSLEPWTPHLQDFLAKTFPQISFTTINPTLNWDTDFYGFRIDCEASQLNINYNTVGTITVPSFSLGIPLTNIMLFNPNPSVVIFEKPQIIFTHDRQRAQETSTATLLESLLKWTQALENINGALQKVKLMDATFTYHMRDKTFTLPHLNLSVRRDRGVLHGQWAIEFDHKGVFSGTFSHHADGHYAIATHLKNFNPSQVLKPFDALLNGAPEALKNLTQINAPLAGDVKFEFSSKKLIHNLILDLRASKGSINLPHLFKTPFPVTSITIQGMQKGNSLHFSALP